MLKYDSWKDRLWDYGFAALLVVFFLGVIKVATGGIDRDNFYFTPDLPAFAPDPLHYSYKNVAIIHLEIGWHNSCTAFVIDNNYAITAGHCLAGKSLNNFVQNQERTLPKPLPVKTVGYNMRVDFGLIKGDFSDFNHASILPTQALSQASIGRMFAACGFPEGQTQVVCTRFLAVSPSDFMILGRGDFYPGMSGGPVIEPISGIVMGIVRASAGSDGMPDMVVVSPLTGFLGAFGI